MQSAELLVHSREIARLRDELRDERDRRAGLEKVIINGTSGSNHSDIRGKLLDRQGQEIDGLRVSMTSVRHDAKNVQADVDHMSQQVSKKEA